MDTSIEPMKSPEELLADEVSDAGVVWICSVERFRTDSGVYMKKPRAERFVHPKDQDAKISVLDHGLLYSMGIFEGINFYTLEGKTGILLLDSHLDRLYDGAEQLGIKVPITKDEFWERMLEAVARSGLEKGYIRPVLTRGVGNQLGLAAKCSDPTLFIYVCPPLALFGEREYANGLSVEVSPYARLSVSEINITRLKWLDYALNAAAKAAAIAKGYDDAIMAVRHPEGWMSGAAYGSEKLEMSRRVISEMTAGNIFFYKDGILHTPSLECNCLDGVTRRAVIDAAIENGITVKEGLFTEKDLLGADEVFETGTAAGVIAMTKINGETVGKGYEGEITKYTRKIYEEEVVPNNLTYVKNKEEKTKLK